MLNDFLYFSVSVKLECLYDFPHELTIVFFSSLISMRVCCFTCCHVFVCVFVSVLPVCVVWQCITVIFKYFLIFCFCFLVIRLRVFLNWFFTFIKKGFLIKWTLHIKQLHHVPSWISFPLSCSCFCFQSVDAVPVFVYFNDFINYVTCIDLLFSVTFSPFAPWKT